jgi:hypothetical protein
MTARRLRESECSDGLRWIAFKVAIGARLTFKQALNKVTSMGVSDEQLALANEDIAEFKRGMMEYAARKREGKI